MQGFFTMDKTQMRCNIDSHEGQRLKYLCIDRTCEFDHKLGCAGKNII